MHFTVTQIAARKFIFDLKGASVYQEYAGDCPNECTAVAHYQESQSYVTSHNMHRQYVTQ